MTALDLTSRPDGWIRKEMGVGGLKTVRELRGEDCIGFDDMPQPKQTTMVSRSFGTEVRDYDELANAIAMFATDAARSIRRANLVSTSVSVFIETNRFGKSPHHARSRSEGLWCMDLRISISGSASVFESLSCLSSSTHRVATISPEPSTGS